MNAQERYQEWLTKLPDGSDMKKELLAIAGNEAEITDRFYQEIVFGTAGLRGICGAGTNRMNELTVGRATQGLAALRHRFWRETGSKPISSRRFARRRSFRMRCGSWDAPPEST